MRHKSTGTLQAGTSVHRKLSSPCYMHVRMLYVQTNLNVRKVTSTPYTYLQKLISVHMHNCKFDSQTNKQTSSHASLRHTQNTHYVPPLTGFLLHLTRRNMSDNVGPISAINLGIWYDGVKSDWATQLSSAEPQPADPRCFLTLLFWLPHCLTIHSAQDLQELQSEKTKNSETGFSSLLHVG
jgi:hypothetical protein